MSSKSRHHPSGVVPVVVRQPEACMHACGLGLAEIGLPLTIEIADPSVVLNHLCMCGDM